MRDMVMRSSGAVTAASGPTPEDMRASSRAENFGAGTRSREFGGLGPYCAASCPSPADSFIRGLISIRMRSCEGIVSDPSAFTRSARDADILIDGRVQTARLQRGPGGTVQLMGDDLAVGPHPQPRRRLGRHRGGGSHQMDRPNVARVTQGMAQHLVGTLGIGPRSRPQVELQARDIRPPSPHRSLADDRGCRAAASIAPPRRPHSPPAC